MLRWPEGRASLRLAGNSDRILLDLCESYDLACNAAAYWSKATLPDAREIADDYRNLVAELEAEAREWASVPRRVTVAPA
jgi:hypothetical protein